MVDEISFQNVPRSLPKRLRDVVEAEGDMVGH